MNELQILTVQGIDCYEVDGTVFLKLEHVARGLDITKTDKKNGNEYKRINRQALQKWLFAFGILDSENDELPKYIPENIFYRLAMKAKNEAAETFQAKIADEVIPSIRRTGGYLTPELAKALADLPALMELLEGMEDRLSALEQGGFQSTGPLPAPKWAQGGFTPGLAARKRWMRTTSEKLALMSARFKTTPNEILHSLYQHLEKRCGVVLDEEKLRVMEDHGLTDCSVLTAIFYNAELRDAFEENIDYNLAPENRGW